MNNIPSPIQKTLLKTCLLGAVVLAFGAIWGFASKDRVILLLSAAVAFLGGVKVLALYRTAAAKHYEILEGTVLADRTIPLRNRHVVLLEDSEQITHKLVLAGKQILKPGSAYRLYLAGSAEQDALAGLPEPMQPARTLLGYERIDIFSYEQPKNRV